MRLTLRTLLAYLDDVLEPAQTKLIGQKIQESAVAGKLVNLIRLVTRQRRLKAPSVSGPNMGIDPNLVAQYLDNTLPPEKVVEVERLLLNSDELLAEAASCHQVLTLLMGKPTEAPPEVRDRLYALGPVAGSNRLQVEETRPVSPEKAALATALQRDADRAAATARTQSEKAVEVPEYLRPNPWSQRLAPAAVVALLVLVCGGLLLIDPGFLTGMREARRELSKQERDAGKSVAEGQGDSGKPADGTATSGASDSTGSKVAVAQSSPTAIADAGGKPPQKGPSATLPSGLDPTPPPDSPATRPAAPGSTTTPVPADVAAANLPADATLAANGTAGEKVPGTLVTQPPVVSAVPVAGAPVEVQYTSNDGVMLILDANQRHWFMVPRRSIVPQNEWLAVLEPFEANFDFDRGAVLATILGDSSIRVLGPNRAASSGLEVRRGRILLRASRKDPQKPTALAIAVGADLWKLELLSSDTVCSIEIVPREPSAFEKPFEQNWYQGGLRVLSGSVKWTPIDGPTQQVGANMALEILPEQAASAARPAPIPSSFAPDWTDSVKRKQSPLRRFASIFEKQFEFEQPVEQTLLALVKDANAKVAELAVRGLGITESSAELVQALAECSFEEGRFAARDGIRSWLPRQADRGPLLKAELEMRYPPFEANVMYLMLWGFRPEDARNRATSLEIASWLRSNHVEIRELAYYWVVQLTSRKWEFRATDVPSRREAGVRRIEAHIEKDGALLKPEQP